MQDSAIFRDVDLVAAKQRIDTAAKLAFVRKLDQQA